MYVRKKTRQEIQADEQLAEEDIHESERNEGGSDDWPVDPIRKDTA